MDGAVEQQVADLLNQTSGKGLAPDVVLAATARVLCLLALASRPAGNSLDDVKGEVMRLVWESLGALATHPFAGTQPGH